MSGKSPEREALEAKAKELDVSFAPNIGDEKLADKVKKAEAAKANAKPPQQPKPPKQTNPPKAKKSDTARFEVIGPKQGFWRAGLRFSDTPTPFEEGELTKKQIAAIEAEPKLTIRPASDTE